MKILSINSVPYGSTCNVMTRIMNMVLQEGNNSVIATGYSYHPITFKVKRINIGNFLDKSVHMICARLFGLNGCFSYLTTFLFLRRVKKISPDIIHLHNLHGWYINISMLFRFIKENNIKVVWTLHDCWSFTGHCPHFDMIGCDKWKTGCHACPQYQNYPKSLFDNSKKMYRLKKKWFTGVQNMTIVTPSQWLADLVKQSYLKDYPVKVVNNGINLQEFHPSQSDFRIRYNCEQKYILLGVAFGWNEKKGLDVFMNLAERLDDNYQIVLVGTESSVDSYLPKNVISIHRTQNTKELAEIYSAADVFVNPTREENYPTVNMEALACGTPVVTFCTGGSPEILDETCGSVIEKDDEDALMREIIRVCEKKPYLPESCIQRARQFDQQERFRPYMQLYQEVIHDRSANG